MAHFCRKVDEKQPFRRAVKAPTASLRMMTHTHISEVDFQGSSLEGQCSGQGLSANLVGHILRVG
jgi:hypothetical protein